jgi:hypothetical protein
MIFFREPLKALSLLFFPCILLIASITFLSQILPVYIGVDGYDMDPVYQYLFNGLLLLHGNVPEHFDHPGTPLQLWSGILIAIRWAVLRPLGLASENIFADVVSQPESYIALISVSLGVLNCWANYFLGKRIYQATNKLGLAIFVQAFVLEYPGFAPRFTHLGAESFLIFAGMLLLGLLAPFIFNHSEQKNTFSKRQAALVGVLAGFGLAVKMNFFPMIGLIFLLDKRKDIATALMWFFGSCLFFLLPVIGRMGRILHWAVDITTHSGRHGGGSEQWIDAAQIGTRAMALISDLPSLTISSCFLISVIVYRVARFDQFRECLLQIKVPVILLGVICLQSLLVIKHPGLHYMIPVLPLGYLGIAWFVQLSLSKSRFINMQSWASYLLVLFAFIIAFHTSKKAFDQLHASKINQTRSYEEISQFLASYPQKLVLGAYRCNLPQCAVSFGGQHATKLGKYLDIPLANFGLFSIWDKQVSLYQSGEKKFSRAQMLAQLSQGTRVFLVTPLLYPEIEAMQLELLVKAPTQYLFELKNLEIQK